MNTVWALLMMQGLFVAGWAIGWHTGFRSAMEWRREVWEEDA